VLTRRDLLQSAVTAGAALAAPTWWSATSRAADRAVSPIEQLRVGVIGVGVRGKYLIGNLPSTARVVAISDCAADRMSDTLRPTGEFIPVLERFAATDARRCITQQDYRRMIDRERLDAVVIATPDHHHVLSAGLALLAGLDVYLEKPLSLTIPEGRWLVNQVRRTGRVLQVGSQQRTMELNRFACAWLRSGGLGKITRVELPNYPGPIATPDEASEPPVHGVDWNLFCGPAPLRSHHRRAWVKDEFSVGDLLWRGWDLYRDYSGHMMTNWGAHSVDMVQWSLGRDDTGPVEIRAEPPASLDDVWSQWKTKTPPPTGLHDRRFWPVRMRYADGVELQFVPGPDLAVFHGERGRLRMRRNFFETDPPGLIAEPPDPAIAERWKGSGHVARPHLENWIDSIATRGEPHAPVEVGHRTVTVCHLANLARELNRPLRWNPVAEQFVGDPAANAMLDRPRRSGFELPAG
jgi:predicted dehydrogenase